MQKEKKSLVLVIGNQFTGKTSFCYTLTNNEIFKKGISATNRGTKELLLGSSIVDNLPQAFSVIDTRGLKEFNYRRENFFLDIQRKLQDTEEECFAYLDCVIYLISLRARQSIEEINETFKNLSFVDQNKNLIFVLTHFDEIYNKKDRDLIINQLMDDLRTLQITGFEKKHMFWINDVFGDPDYDRRIDESPDLKMLKGNQRIKLASLMNACEKIEMRSINVYRNKLLDYIGELIINDPKKSPKIIREKLMCPVTIELEECDWIVKPNIFERWICPEKYQSFAEIKKEREKKINQNVKKQKICKMHILQAILKRYIHHDLINHEVQGSDLIIFCNEAFCKVFEKDLQVQVIFENIEGKNALINYVFSKDRKSIKITQDSPRERKISFSFNIIFENFPTLSSLMETYRFEIEKEKPLIWQSMAIVSSNNEGYRNRAELLGEKQSEENRSSADVDDDEEEEEKKKSNPEKEEEKILKSRGRAYDFIERAIENHELFQAATHDRLSPNFSFGYGMSGFSPGSMRFQTYDLVSFKQLENNYGC